MTGNESVVTGDTGEIVMDLRNTPMPGHIQNATKAIERAAAGEEIILLTDQEVVIKYVPTEAALQGVRTKMSMAGDDEWRVVLFLGQQVRGGEKS
jgi:TusA-related sulfurtransferase